MTERLEWRVLGMIEFIFFRRMAMWAAVVVCAGWAGSSEGAELVSVPHPDAGIALNGKLFRPSAPGVYPGVIVMHGSGGLWRNDDPDGGVMSRHFEEWGEMLSADGYVVLFIDSYTPRGLVDFRSRRPAEDPDLDDAVCSSNYVRPRDAYAALNYLRTLPDVHPRYIGLMGFSHGAQSVLAAMVDESIQPETWTVSYRMLNGDSVPTAVPGPHRPPADGGFRAAVAYYPGCGFFSYFGSPSSTAAGLYMPYAPSLMFHGDEDSLYADDLYPVALVGKSAAQAMALGLESNPLTARVFSGADHSFDEAILPDPWDPDVADADQLARYEATELTRGFLERHLKWPSVNERVIELTLIEVQDEGASLRLVSTRAPGGSHRLEVSENLVNWARVEDAVVEDGEETLTWRMALEGLPMGQPQMFFRVWAVDGAPNDQ